MSKKKAPVRSTQQNSVVEDDIGTPTEMKQMLQGLGVKKVEKMADVLAANGIETRSDLSKLDDDFRKELDEALKEGGITIGDRAKLKKAGFEVKEVTKQIGNAEVSVPQLVPGQAMQTASKLERVFLGMGWAGKACQNVDVDASCVAFSAGAVADLIFFQKLKNESKSLVHTGDVLQGAKASEKQDLEDMERIYIWLQKLPQNIDCLVFVANIYTQGVNLENLENAYVRLCNADTNQELCRVPLSGGGLKGNCLVFAKLYRTRPQKGAKGDALLTGPPWQILGLGMPATVAGMTSVDQMIPMLQKTGTCLPAQPIADAPSKPINDAPLKPAKKLAKGGGRASHNSGAKDGKSLKDPKDPKGKSAESAESAEQLGKEQSGKAQKPRSVLPCVALGVATAVGIGAATAIYMNPELTSDMMGSEVFTSGVDFGADALEWSGDALVGAGDLIGDGAGEVYGWAGSVVDNVPGMDSIGEGLGCAADYAGDGLEFGLDGAGVVGEGALGAGGAAVGFLGDGQNWENAGETVLGAGGDAVNFAGDAGGAAAGWVGDAADGGAVEWAGGAGEDVLGAGGDAVGWAGDAGGAAVGWAGDGQNWENAGGTVMDAGGAAVNGAGGCCQQIMAMVGGADIGGLVGEAVKTVGDRIGMDTE